MAADGDNLAWLNHCRQLGSRACPDKLEASGFVNHGPGASMRPPDANSNASGRAIHHQLTAEYVRRPEQCNPRWVSRKKLWATGAADRVSAVVGEYLNVPGKSIYL
jgi:hypothetical protein